MEINASYRISQQNISCNKTFVGNIHLILVKVEAAVFIQVCTVSQGVRLDRERSERTYFLVLMKGRGGEYKYY